MKERRHVPTRMRWARFRFGVISPLLTKPPEPGELAAILDELAARSYQHPVTGASVRFGRSTIEHWLYAARAEPDDPISALARKVHGRAGMHPSVSAALRAAIVAQHRAHPRWSFKLHHDNLLALGKTQPEIGKVPSVTVLRRFMKGLGLVKHKGSPAPPRRRWRARAAAVRATLFADASRLAHPTGVMSQVNGAVEIQQDDGMLQLGTESGRVGLLSQR